MFDNPDQKTLARIDIIASDTIVLCHLPNNPVTPFVTWLLDQEGNTYLVHYHQDYGEAMRDFWQSAAYRLIEAGPTS